MGRLVSWPEGLSANFREPLTGPRAVGAASTQATSGFVQTSGAAFGLWRWRFQFPPIRGQLYRRYRGWITSLHGGANATRVPFCDWDGLTAADAGVNAAQWGIEAPWSNGMPWSNGKNWSATPPMVAVSAITPRDGTVVSLGSAFWGHQLDIGDLLGFFPFHFGLYMVTEVIDPGTYRIWPPLRKAITADEFATLRPTLAMRLEGEEGANAPRGVAFAEGLSVTLIETLDYDVRDYFKD